ncbi:MAG: RNA polymerase sigma factor [Phycisphaeraceae bacterium]
MAHPPALDEDDAALVAAARRGEAGAMDRLLRKHQQRVYRICLRMLGNRDDAAESAQDALVKVMQSLDGFREEARFTTWITRIAMNQALTRRRRRRVRDTVSLDGPARAASSPGPDDQASALRLHLADAREPEPSARVEQEDELRAVGEALAELDETFRAVLVLRDVEQMDYQGVADTLELPVGTVKSRLFRARLALRQKLADREEFKRSQPASPSASSHASPGDSPSSQKPSDA